MATESYEIQLERDVSATMRDGVLLRGDVYRPKGDGKFPVLMQRTPYNKANYNANGAPFAIRAATQGYVVILQDVRGRYRSDGEWYPYRHEFEDGYDSVEWAAALPYANGKVGMFGWSYVGATQLHAALPTPPHLAGIYPVVTCADYYDGWTYQGGAFEQWWSQSWLSWRLTPDTLHRRLESGSNAMQWVRQLPLADYPMLKVGSIRDLAPYYIDWLQHPSYDDYWKEFSLAARHNLMQVPAYHVGGWYDAFLGGTLKNYMGIKARGGSEAARRGQRLMIGPWCHDPASFLGGKAGEVEFGSNAQCNEEDVCLRYYDWLLKGIPNGFDQEKPVKVFVMGSNTWREEDEWPLARAQNTRFYLHSGGYANSLNGGGLLSTVPPQGEPPDRYVYDPDDPVPTRGGGLCGDAKSLAPGAFDQRANEAREDVLVYTTPVLTEDLEVIGPVIVELHVSSSAIDTDFTAKLVDVWPNGFAQNLTDGIRRGRYRNSPSRAEYMNPGGVYPITVDLWATANQFKVGHRVRLEISSSNFPRFDRNLNTGECLAGATRWVKATNTVFHDREHPSAVVLPVIPD